MFLHVAMHCYGLHTAGVPRNAHVSNAATIRFLPSLVELARECGVLSEVLRKYSWVLQAADKWAEQDAARQEKLNDPNRLPLHDPWQYLIDAPTVAERDKDVCRAARSQIYALRRLVRMPSKVATLKTDWQQEAVKARGKNELRSAHAANKVANAMMGYSVVQADVGAKIERDVELLESVASWQRRRHAQLVHDRKRSEAKESKPLPTWKEIQTQFPFETMLAFRWVRLVSNGPPGLMFWRNEALTEFLFKVRKRERNQFPNLGRDYIKKTRQCLGLIPVGITTHLVWDVSVSPDKAGRWNIKGYKRNGDNIFSGSVPDLSVY